MNKTKKDLKDLLDGIKAGDDQDSKRELVAIIFLVVVIVPMFLLLFVAAAAGVVAFFGFLTMAIWNLLAPLFSVTAPLLTFWQGSALWLGVAMVTKFLSKIFSPKTIVRNDDEQI